MRGRDNKLSASRDEQLKEIEIETDNEFCLGETAAAEPRPVGLLQIRNRDGILYHQLLLS